MNNRFWTKWFYFIAWLMLASTSAVSAQTIPAGFVQIASDTGVTAYQKDYSGGSPDFLVVADLRSARLHSLVGSFTANSGGCLTSGGQDLRISRISLNSHWNNAAAAYPGTFAVFNAGFFIPTDDPTSMGYCIFERGNHLSEGHGCAGYPGYKGIMRINSATARGTMHADYSAATFYANDGSDVIIGSQIPDNPDDYRTTGRTFIGLYDSTGDGANNMVVVFCSLLATRAQARDTLSACGVPVANQLMLDGGGSSQLRVGSSMLVSSSRLIPHAMAIVAGWQTGGLKVTIEPQGARDAGARWRRAGSSTWHSSGETEGGLPTATYGIEFKDVANWDKPANFEIAVADNQTATATRTYQPLFGHLRMDLAPPDAVAAGAQWRRTGTSTWFDSGATEQNIPLGTYAVEFKDLDVPWIKPGNQDVTISAGQTLVRAVRYNRPPVLSPLTNWFVHVNAAVEFSVEATDPDGDSITLTMTGAPSGAMFPHDGGNGTFRFVPSPAQAGQSHSVVFTATDGVGGSDAETVAIQVGSPPMVAPLSNAVVVLSNLASFAVTATDPENDSKTFSMAGAPQGSTLTGEGDARQFSYTAAQRDAGNVFPVTFTATDVDGSGSTSMSLRVKSPPLFVPIDSRRVLVSNLLVFSVAAVDPDGDAMNYSVSNAPPSSSFSPHAAGGVFSYFPSAGAVGQVFAVQFRAVDVDGMRTMTVPITVVGTAGELVLFTGHRNVINDFGGRMESVSYVSETAGAQGQPVGTSAGANWLNFAGFLLPFDAASTSVWEIVATAGEGGTIAPSGTVEVANGSNQVFTLAPDEYYFVSNVVVDGVSMGSTNAYEFTGVFSNRTIHALFAPHQTSQGVPWEWLASFGLTNQPWEEAAVMNHGGGRPAWEAWVAGTDPTNPATAFIVLSAKSSGGMAQVDVRTVPGRRYIFWGATNLIDPVWQRAQYSLTPSGSLTNEMLAATSGQTTIYMPMGISETYIRTEVQRPEE